MANASNDLVGTDALGVPRPAPIYYDSTYITFRYDNIAATRRIIVAGGTQAPGPGSGYGQIFPVKQDK